MARGKADKQLTVGKKLEIIAEADRTGQLAVTAQKYGVKTGQIRDWKKNIDRLRATDPSRLVCASNVQRGHLVFNESYAQYWVGYNKFCSSNMTLDDVKHEMYIMYKDIYREGVKSFDSPEVVDPSATHALESPSNNGFYPTPEEKELLVKDMTKIREHLKAFFDNMSFPTKYMYYVTKFDFVKPDPNEGDDEDEEEEEDESKPAKPAKQIGIEDVITFYVAVCGNGSVMVPMAIFPPVEEDHWERKKTIKLRHAHSMHRTKMNDPNEALQFFSVTWKKFYEEEAKYNDKFVFLLDESIEEFHLPEFQDGIRALEGYDKSWTTVTTVRNPLRLSNFEDSICTFVVEEWRKILQMKKSSQPNDYRKCVAFWFYSVWELYAGDNARASFRGCNMYLEDKEVWKWGIADDV